MRHIGGPVSRTESGELIDHFEEHWSEWGYGVFAIALAESDEFIGFVGLNHHRLFPADVEIGWRLRRACWGLGLATEGASTVIAWALSHLRDGRLPCECGTCERAITAPIGVGVAVAAVANEPSAWSGGGWRTPPRLP